MLKLKLRMRQVQHCYLKGPNLPHLGYNGHFLKKNSSKCQKTSKIDIHGLKLKLRMR